MIVVLIALDPNVDICRYCYVEFDGPSKDNDAHFQKIDTTLVDNKNNLVDRYQH